VSKAYSIGTSGLSHDIFDKVCCFCVSGDDLFVTDCAANFVQKRDKGHPEFEFHIKVGTTGIGNDNFRSPRGMCCEGDYIYICDRNNSRIVKRTKTDLTYVAQFGGYGNGNDEFYYPEDICSDGTYFYIADTWNRRIKKHLVSDFSYIAEIGSDGSGDDQFNLPKGICYYDGYLFVADTYNDRIMKRLASDLSFVSKIGTEGSGDDQFDNVIQICCSPDGFLYIADSMNYRIVKRNASDLSYVSKIGSQGAGDDEFDYPHGIFYSDNYIYVGDYNNHRFVKRKAGDLSFVAERGENVAGIDATGETWKTIYSFKITETIGFSGFQLTKVGTWAGTAKYRILCGSRKIYPEEYEDDIDSGVYQIMKDDLKCAKNNTFRIQFRSTDDTDQGPDQKMMLEKVSILCFFTLNIQMSSDNVYDMVGEAANRYCPSYRSYPNKRRKFLNPSYPLFEHQLRRGEYKFPYLLL
jgi:hypothetical protein